MKWSQLLQGKGLEWRATARLVSGGVGKSAEAKGGNKAREKS